MSALTWQDAGGGVGLRVTVPVAMSPDQAARDLAPRLSALAGERAPASSGEVGTRPGVPVVTIDGYSGSGKSTLASALTRLVNGWQVLHLGRPRGWSRHRSANRRRPAGRTCLLLRGLGLGERNNGGDDPRAPLTDDH